MAAGISGSAESVIPTAVEGSRPVPGGRMLGAMHQLSCWVGRDTRACAPQTTRDPLYM
jgi:hypothetical protein